MSKNFVTCRSEDYFANVSDYEPVDHLNSLLHYVIKLTNHEPHCLHWYCGGYRSRTDDPLRARQML